MGKPQERETNYLRRGNAAVWDRHLSSPLCYIVNLGPYLHSINPTDYKVSYLYVFFMSNYADRHMLQNLELKVCINKLYIGNRRTYKGI